MKALRLLAAAIALSILAAASPPPPPLGILGRQVLPQGRCAAFLWQVAPEPPLLAMVRPGSEGLRLVVDGVQRDLAPVAPSPAASAELPATARYGDALLTVTTDLMIERQAGLADGALIPSGTLTIERAGQDVVVVPVSGMFACRTLDAKK